MAEDFSDPGGPFTPVGAGALPLGGGAPPPPAGVPGSGLGAAASLRPVAGGGLGGSNEEGAWVEGKAGIVCVKLDSLSDPQALSSTARMGRCARGPRKLCFKPPAGCAAAGRAKPKAPATHSVKAGPKGLYLFLREMETQKSRAIASLSIIRTSRCV